MELKLELAYFVRFDIVLLIEPCGIEIVDELSASAEEKRLLIEPCGIEIANLDARS